MFRFQLTLFRRRVLFCTLLGVLSATGCGRAGVPSTTAVKGKVVLKGGDVKSLAGGLVEFESVANPEIAASGEIEADGSFSLTTTSKDGTKVFAGAVAGEHRVRVEPPNPLEEISGYLIDPRFHDFAKSGIRITIPSDKEIVIEVHRPKR